MESPPLTLLSLPRELRDQIYSECADWSDTTQQLLRTLAEWVHKDKAPPYTKRTTPTILLLNKQITREAMPVLRKKPLTLACPKDHGMREQNEVPNMLRLISKCTLANVQHLVVKLESWEWIYSLDHLLPHLAKSTNLKTFHILFKDHLRPRFLADQSQQYPDATLHTTLVALAKIRGLNSAIFEGDLPACYTAPLAQIMQSPTSSVADTLPKLRALKGDGTTVELKDEDVNV